MQNLWDETAVWQLKGDNLNGSEKNDTEYKADR